MYKRQAVVKGSDVTVDGINAAMKAAESDSFGYNEDQIVSSDIVGITYGSLFDSTQTMVSPIGDDLYQVQVVSWYDLSLIHIYIKTLAPNLSVFYVKSADDGTLYICLLYTSRCV